MKKTLFPVLLATLMLISQAFTCFAATSSVINRVVEYKTIKAAKAVLDFEANTPKSIPKGYKQSRVAVIDGKTLRITYTGGNHEICFSTAKGTSDLSGDYNKYPEVKSRNISGVKVSTKGKDGKISVATFTVNKISYAFTFTDAVTLKALTAMIENLGVTAAQAAKPVEGVTFKDGTLVITLEENATTGYTWQYTIENPKILKLSNDEYKQNKSKTGSAGVGGVHTYTFKALAKGKTLIKFSLDQSWSGGEKGAKTKTFEVLVGENNRISKVVEK